MSRIEDYANAIEQVLSDRKLIDGPIPWRAWAGPEFLGCDACAFEIDMARFQIKRIEALHSPATIKAISTRLGGLKVGFANTQGFLYLVKNEPVPELLDFPDVIPLPNPPESNYLIPFGVTKEGKAEWRSIFRTHNIAIGGLTQYGKTTFFFAIYLALIAQHSPSELQIAMVDGKDFEFESLTGSPYLINGKPVSETTEVASLIDTVWKIVEQRKQAFKKHRVGNLESYAKKTGERLAIVILFVDEIKDLIDNGLDTTTLHRILQQGVGLGVFCIIGTQSPDSKTIKKTNFGTMMSFRLSNAIESQILFIVHEPYHILKNGDPGELIVLGPDLNYSHLKGFYVKKHASKSTGNGPVLSKDDKILVAIAVKKFGGYCPIDRIVEFVGTLPLRYRQIFTKYLLQKKFAEWEANGWLEPSVRQPDGTLLARRVTDRLRKSAGV